MEPKGIWYSPVSGIWQTVWLEAVNSTHILQVLPTADIHKKTVSLDISVAKAKGGEKVKVELLDEGKVVGTTEQKLASKIEMEVPEAVLWSPSSPKLYHLNIELLSQGQVIDKVKSYFAMREVSIRKDECGYQRICLNGDPIFQYGTLDQGWWPDGLLTLLPKKQCFGIWFSSKIWDLIPYANTLK